MNKLFWIWILSCAFHFSGTAQGLNNAILMHNTGNRQVVSVSTDVQENRYIVIKTTNSDSVFVQKMDSLGTMLWQRFWVSPFSAARAEADASGMVYVSGSSTGSFDMDPGPGTSPSAATNAVVVVCLDPNGTFSWGRTTNVIPGFSGSCTLIDTEPIGGGILIYGNWFGRVDIDPSAAVFQPVSQISGSGGSFILRLDQAGNTININLVESSCCNEYQVAVAPNGKYAVAFTTGDSLAVYGQGVYSLYAYTLSNQNYCVVEFDQFGGLAWRSDLIDGGFSTNTQICYDQQSNLYIKGNEGIDTDLDPGPGFDDTTALLGGTCFLMKLDANRNREWIKMIETGFNYNTPGLFAINELNEIFLSGYGTNDGLTGSDIPESSPLSSPGLISIDPPVSTPGSDPDPYLVKLNTCAEIEWKRFGQMFRSEAAFNNAEDLVFCGVFGNNFDLDPDPVTTWFTPFSTVGENLMLLHFDKSGYCRPSPYNGTGSGVFIQEVKIKNFNTFLPNYVFRDTVVGFTGSSSYQESTVSGSYLSQGEYYYVWVTVAPSINSTVAAWFDTNGDLYYDANEAIGSYQTSVFGNTVSFTLYVPYVGTPVLSRLRIRNVCCDSQVDPCCNYDAGQTIDYLINTQPGVSDVAVEEIIPIPASSSPGVTGACPGYYNPVAVFRNIGTTTVTIFLGDLYVDSTLLQPNPFSMTTGPGDVYYLTFGPAVYFEAGKSYAFSAYCYASGDTNLSNNFMSFYFTMPDLPPYTVTPSAPCLQSPISIEFQLPSGVSVNWYDGTTGPFVNVLGDILPFKTVPFTMSDSLGCTFTDTIDVPVTPLPPTPSINYVYHQGAYYLLATSVSSVQFFSWLKNGVTHATTTNDSLPNPIPGSTYQLIIQDQTSGCFSDTSQPFLFNPMGFDEVSHQVNLVSVLPNPFTDHLVIDFGEKGVQQDSRILLTDMQGRIVLPPDFLKSGTRVYRLETSGLSNGIYMLRLSGDRSNQTIRLVKGE